MLRHLSLQANGKTKVLEQCRHAFCCQCLEQFTQGAGGDASCPLCRAPHSADEAFADAVTLIVRAIMQYGAVSSLNIDSDIRKALEQVLILDPNHFGAMVTLGEALVEAEPIRAQQLLIKAIVESKKPVPPAHLALGKALQTAGNFNGAVSEYRKAIALAKAAKQKNLQAHARMTLAVACEEVGEMEMSLQEYKTAMEVDPTNSIIPFNMGVARLSGLRRGPNGWSTARIAAKVRRQADH